MSSSKLEAARALRRVESAGALPTLVRGGLPADVLEQLLADALPERAGHELPAEIWAGLAVGIAAENDPFAELLAERIDDHLAWESEPTDLEAWWPVVRERPLEALWMAACSEQPSVRGEFHHIARHCVENFRASPEDAPPSWEFVEGMLGVQARTLEQLRASERRAAEAERRAGAARQRLEALRSELKRLRRENADLRAFRSTAEPEAEPEPAAAERKLQEQRERVERLELRLRKLDKEREHLRRQLDRGFQEPSEATQSSPSPAAPPPSAAMQPAPDPAGGAAAPADPGEPRTQLLHFILRKLLAKGKIGASHTHEDNVYRGVPDHQKGLAKRIVGRLYKEGFLLPKPTVHDPHLSLSPERMRDVRGILEGRLDGSELVGSVRARSAASSSDPPRETAS